jgi:hypothetical protein
MAIPSIATPPEGGGFMESLLEGYAPKSETFEIVLPRGEKLSFRAFSTYRELADFKREMSAFGKKIKRLDDAQNHPFFSLYKPETDDEIAAAFTIHYLSIEPKFEIAQAFGLLRAPWLAEHIVEQVDAHRMRFILDQDAVEEQKKD